MSELDSSRPERGGSIERTLAGRAELEILPVIREAWQLVHGVRAMLVAGLLIVYAAVLAASLVLGSLLGVDETTALGGAISQLVMMMIVYPFMAGVFLFGLRRSVGEPVRFEDQFACYRQLLPIVMVGALQSLVTFLGLMLLIVPGIYLMIALSLAVPLKAERDLPVIDCLLVSMRLVNRKFFEVTVLSLTAALLAALGVVTLIGWIWTVPWTVMILAIIYRQLAGYTLTGPAAPGADGRLEI